MTDAGDVLPPFNVPSNVDCWCETDTEATKVRYMWRIMKFSQLREATGEKLVSSSFSASPSDKEKWSLLLYPRGSKKEEPLHVSLHLKYESENLETNLAFEFSVLNYPGDKVNIKKGSHKFTANEGTWGYPKFIERDFLLNENNGLLPNDVMTIYCEVAVVAKPKNIHHDNPSVMQEDTRIRLTEDFGHLLNSKKFSDVVLVADERELNAHKCILAARSTVFAAMFEHDMTENRENRVLIPDINHNALQALVRFIYTGKVPALMDEGLAAKLVSAADKYCLADLKATCERELSMKLCSKNVVQLITLANLHNAKYLRARIVEFMKSRAMTDADSSLWDRLIIIEQPNVFTPAGVFQQCAIL